MRIALLLVAGCAAPLPAAAPSSPVAVRSQPVADVALPTLAQPGTLYMLEVHGANPQCDAWTVDPARHVLISTGAHATTTIAFRVAAGAIALTGIERRVGASMTTGACTSGNSGAAYEQPDAVVYEGARWFRSRQACAAAIDRYARVAMMWPCEIDDRAAVTRTRARFEKLLARGGIGFEPDRCAPIRFDATPHANRIEGTLSFARSDDGVVGRSSYAYALTPDEARLEVRWHDCDAAAGEACPDAPLTYAPDHVGDLLLLSGLYFDAASCHAADDHACALAAWRPATEHGTPGC